MTIKKFKKPPLPKYSGTRPLKEILKACKKNFWPTNTVAHDKQGSDWVLIGFIHQSRRFEVSLCAFNGKFIVKDGSKYVTEESTEYDDVEWYRALLDFLYFPADTVKKKKEDKK